MNDVILVLTAMPFMCLSSMTLECTWRLGFWAAWAVFSWFLTVGFAWLLLADVLARAFDYAQLAEAPVRSGVFRALVFAGTLQWLLRQPRGGAHG